MFGVIQGIASPYHLVESLSLLLNVILSVAKDLVCQMEENVI